MKCKKCGSEITLPEFGDPENELCMLHIPVEQMYKNIFRVLEEDLREAKRGAEEAKEIFGSVVRRGATLH